MSDRVELSDVNEAIRQHREDCRQALQTDLKPVVEGIKAIDIKIDEVKTDVAGVKKDVAGVITNVTVVTSKLYGIESHPNDPGDIPTIKKKIDDFNNLKPRVVRLETVFKIMAYGGVPAGSLAGILKAVGVY